MRIAFLAPEFMPTWGGVGIYSVNLVRELSKDHALELHVITPRRGGLTEEEIERQFGNKIKVHQLTTANDTFFYNAKFQLAVAREFSSLNERYSFDLIHSANLVHMPDILLKFRKLGIPSVVTAHTTIGGQVNGFLQGNRNFLKMAPSEKGSILAYPLISVLERIYLARTDHVITVSHRFARQLKENGYHGTVDVTHNGILLDVFDYASVTDPLRDFPELAHITEPMVLFAGRLITQKGIEVLVKAMSALRGQGVHFVIAGTGDVPGFEKLIARYGIDKKNYTYLGFIDNQKLPALYKLCSLFVLPSFYENLPISILEAMSMKCCCIATDVGAVTEIIDDGVDGIIIEPGDSEALVEKIQYLIEHDEERREMAERGYHKIQKDFTAAAMAAKTTAIYQRIIP